jgi:pyrroline-5-carboxylate reductase
MTGLVRNMETGAEQLQAARTILEAAGETVVLDDENQLDAVTAVSGSGPAYIFYLLEAMIDAGCELGLAPDVAHRLATQTALGASLMACRSDASPSELRRNVTSPGGTTERAVDVLDAGGARDVMITAIRQAAARSRELTAQFGSQSHAGGSDDD